MVTSVVSAHGEPLTSPSQVKLGSWCTVLWSLHCEDAPAAFSTNIWLRNLMSTWPNCWDSLNVSYAVCQGLVFPPSLVWGVPHARENSLSMLTVGGITGLSHFQPPVWGSGSIQINQEGKRMQKSDLCFKKWKQTIPLLFARCLVGFKQQWMLLCVDEFVH